MSISTPSRTAHALELRIIRLAARNFSPVYLILGSTCFATAIFVNFSCKAR